MQFQQSHRANRYCGHALLVSYIEISPKDALLRDDIGCCKVRQKTQTINHLANSQTSLSRIPCKRQKQALRRRTFLGRCHNALRRESQLYSHRITSTSNDLARNQHVEKLTACALTLAWLLNATPCSPHTHKNIRLRSFSNETRHSLDSTCCATHNQHKMPTNGKRRYTQIVHFNYTPMTNLHFAEDVVWTKFNNDLPW